MKIVLSRLRRLRQPSPACRAATRRRRAPVHHADADLSAAHANVSPAEPLRPLDPEHAPCAGRHGRRGAQEPRPPKTKRLVIHDGKESWIDAEAAARSGYTIIDFSDDWTPFIFAEQRAPDGTVLHNRYRRVFIGLANDTLDEDGEPLPAGEKNYLELYGVPPSFGVLRERFLANEQQTCHATISQEKLEEVETIAYVAPEKMKAEEQRTARLRRETRGRASEEQGRDPGRLGPERSGLRRPR